MLRAFRLDSIRLYDSLRQRESRIVLKRFSLILGFGASPHRIRGVHSSSGHDSDHRNRNQPC